jgi:cytochrome c peroxidase
MPSLFRATALFVVAAALTITPGLVSAEERGHDKLPNPLTLLDSSGMIQTFSTNGGIDTGGAFFQSLGSNGRSCASCHLPDQGWSVSPPSIQLRFLLTNGQDPIFRTVDGSNCDHNINVSSLEGRREAFSLLLNKGLLRVALPVPAGAEFQVVSVDNKYGCSESATLSMYRRPLPSANLKFLTTVMHDGRESTAPSTQKITNAADLLADLAHQAQDATSGHAQGLVALTPHQLNEIVNFEMGLFTAQIFDFRTGPLNTGGATGGPAAIATQNFFVGINDPLGNNPLNTPFTSEIFSLYGAWSHTPANDRRASIARGETLFNTKPIKITGVGGLNDVTGLPVINGFCGTCHSSPNVGNHSVSAPLNIGVADLTNSLGVSYLPVFTLHNPVTGATVQTTDPGRAMVTGKWADIGKTKGLVLRGLAARAPYFHNASAKTLGDVIDFYNVRFNVGITAQEKADLVDPLVLLTIEDARKLAAKEKLESYCYRCDQSWMLTPEEKQRFAAL